ncbi:hypothetical protein H7K28_12625 [Paenibacillus polymyxa]|jgi:hypothetical protein|uniref:hypothetical protein n=1 Tax=Paenibacillus TaxID=44249 RepID=UPI000D304FE9|nr:MULTISPECIES: hypothetical protein [Paenibacillus]KAF6616175.1 hypothetical protein HFE00_16765 [Paenibacillus sp. EKM101P]KAF6618009.1 hypothetical protein HFE03_23300 [Paenibacillus sp. EKM102P]KAF6626065.1 hypothetical protein HFE01_23140 [Paenibacillus sp. EKM10P]KAF6642582.1 hypothetical protein HFE02_23305 [Paenibacillus sp. EKM11P]MBY0020915.1 hypothetical protein [Paenibacillus polymyxa]
MNKNIDGRNTFNNQTPKNTGEKGYSLEYMVTGLFQSQGYLARRSIPLQYGPVNQDATDVDVLGIQFTLPFRGHRIICDCKNKQKSKPYERIFWAKGLGEFTNASDVYVALPKTSSEIINFALTGGVRVLTNDKVSQFSSIPSGSYGIADEKFYKGFFAAIDRVLKNDKQAEKICLIVRKLYLKDDPFTSVNIAFDYLKIATKQLSISKYNSDHNTFWKYLCCELVVLIGLQILWICADTYSLSEKAREERILTKLTYGELEASQVHKLLNSAGDLANEIVRASIPSSYLPKTRLIEFGEFPPPEYAYSLIGIVERALQNPQWYVDMPQLLDFLLFEQGLKGKDFSDNAYRHMFKSGLSDEKLKASKNILSFVKDSVGFEWKSIWSKPLEEKLVPDTNKQSNDGNSDPHVEKINDEVKNIKTISISDQETKNIPSQTILNEKSIEMNNVSSTKKIDNKVQSGISKDPRTLFKQEMISLKGSSVAKNRSTVSQDPFTLLNDDFISKYTSYKNLNQLLKDNQFRTYDDIMSMKYDERNLFSQKVSKFSKWDDLLKKAVLEITETRLKGLKEEQE